MNFSISDFVTIILRIFFTGTGFVINFILYNNFNLDAFTGYILFIAAAEIASSIIKIGMPTVILKLASNNNKSTSYLNVLSSYNSISIIFLIITTSLFYIIYELNFLKFIFVLIPLASFLMTYHVIIFNLIRSRIKYNKIIYLESFVKNAFFLFILFLFRDVNENSIILSFLAGNIISIIFLIYYSFKAGLKVFVFKLNFKFFREDGIQIGLFNILQTAPRQMIYFLLNFFGFNNLIAELKLALSFVNIVKIPNVSFGTKFSPKLVKIENFKIEAFYLKKNLTAFSYTVLAFCFLYFLVPDFIFELIININSQQILSLAMYISIHLLIDSYFSLNGTLLLMKNMQKKLLINYSVSNFFVLTLLFLGLVYEYSPSLSIVSFFIVNSIIFNFLNNYSLIKFMNINSYRFIR